MTTEVKKGNRTKNKLWYRGDRDYKEGPCPGHLLHTGTQAMRVTMSSIDLIKKLLLIFNFKM